MCSSVDGGDSASRGPSPPVRPPPVAVYDCHFHLDALLAKGRATSFADLAAQEEGGDVVLLGGVANYAYPDSWSRRQGQMAGDPSVKVAIGLHPHKVGRGRPLMAFLQQLRDPACTALGEVGIELTSNCSCAGRCPKPAECWQQVTRDQVTTLTPVLQGAVVEGGGRPVIIHCKDGGSGRAAQKALGCFRRVPGASTLAVHWHCFTGSVEDIEAWRQLLPNLHIGVTVLSLRAPSTRLALGGIDPSRLLLSRMPPTWCLREPGLESTAPGS
ncbi:deoxyribonuclease TATDN2 [Mizuhopecten yessoensis]|uniref:Deoxyribonuclease TATDN2 n=2 Tax=Mizuhopecten yessoensis TaxID=6573 RepID=A0A210QL18_MIZYE|nr:deoxyribonuclease TATDN2 [Mizuhopecten yessoensis]